MSLDVTVKKEVRAEVVRLMKSGEDFAQLLDDVDSDTSLQAKVKQLLEAQLEQMSDELAGEPELAPRFASMYEFVDFVRAVYAQAEGRRPNWPAQWYLYPHAIVRLDALWKRFEKHRLEDPACGMEAFLRINGDYHLGVLMRSDGPFFDARSEYVPTADLPSDIDGHTTADARES